MAERAAKTIDDRFDEVAHAFREQREYTEFCFESLRLESRQRFDAIDQRFDSMDRRLTNHELLLSEILNEVKKR